MINDQVLMCSQTDRQRPFVQYLGYRSLNDTHSQSWESLTKEIQIRYVIWKKLGDK